MLPRMNESSRAQAPETPGDPDGWLRRPWTEQAFRTRDAVDYRNVCGLPLYGPASGDEANDPCLVLIPGGWDHEHCELCAKTISEEPEDEQVGYTNGEEWLCCSCYQEHVVRERGLA
jgi:hypothetical protein